MKKILLILILFLTSLYMKVSAAPFEVVVLPVSNYEVRENFYNFKNADEIFAQDVINEFNSSSKVHAVDLYALSSKLSSDSSLKMKVDKALALYDKNRNIDYQTMRQLANALNARSVLLISANAIDSKERVKRNVWELLNLASVFDLAQDNDIKIEAVLLDDVNDLVMWSSIYKFRILDSQNSFSALDYAQAVEQYEKIKLFSENILSKSVSQNVTLRFYPKSISTVDVKTVGESIDSGLLKYNKNVPTRSRFSKPKKVDEDEIKEEYYGEMIFSL